MISMAIIGSGFGLYGLLPAFHALAHCQVVAFCGRQSPRLLKILDALCLQGTIRLYSDWREMLTCEKLDAIAIAVPPAAQYPIAKTALEKNIHVFAEKPLAAQLTHAYELADLARRKNLTHGVDFLFPEIDVWQMAKGMLDEKQFGDVCHVAVSWDFRSYDVREKVSSWKTDSTIGGGALAFYFSHVLHYLEYFAGPIADLESRLSYSPHSLKGGEVGVDLELKFGRGARGTAHLLCDSPQVRHELIFTCQSGKISLENQQSIVEKFILKAVDSQGHTTTVVSRDFTPSKGADNDERVLIVKRLAKKFIEACLQRQQMTPSFVQGARVQELIEQVRQKSLAESRGYK